jgi:hypothetical protein
MKIHSRSAGSIAGLTGCGACLGVGIVGLIGLLRLERSNPRGVGHGWVRGNGHSLSCFLDRAVSASARTISLIRSCKQLYVRLKLPKAADAQPGRRWVHHEIAERVRCRHVFKFAFASVNDSLPLARRRNA